MKGSSGELRNLFAGALEDHVRSVALARFDASGSRLASRLRGLYGHCREFDGWLGDLLQGIAGCVNLRPDELRDLDEQRPADWFMSSDMLAYSAYVDRFASGLKGVVEKIPYLCELGVGYLHLLPFHRARAGESDGGFAVSDYEETDPTLGTTGDLELLTAHLRSAGISLCADFVLNHTADDHRWAVAARSGDRLRREFYHVLEDRAEVERYEESLGEVFPQTAPGNFTRVGELDAWVWTTFYPYQWDLNWSNPDVFAAMALTLLRNANRGIEVFRLDSVPFLWKRIGTRCVNQPEVHEILRALRTIVALAAPSVLLKAEAIVAADELPAYFGTAADDGRECHLAYHNVLMAASWAALALQRGDIVAEVVRKAPAVPNPGAWLNYVRCHDDIGWGVLAAGATSRMSVDLDRVSRFFCGDEPGSYARGRAFQTEPAHRVHGTCGMTSALAGLESATVAGDRQQLELAIRRLLLLYGVALCIPGIPLIYMGDEVALGNSTLTDPSPEQTRDSRWLHRPRMDWQWAAARHDPVSPQGRVFAGLQRMITVRRETPALAPSSPIDVVPAARPELLAMRRGGTMVCVFNFSEGAIEGGPELDVGGWKDVLTGRIVGKPWSIGPLEMRWLVPR